jgi:hypothetical protein
MYTLISDAVDTVVCAPDDRWKYHPKSIEQFPDINKLCKVVSCWIYILGYISAFFRNFYTTKHNYVYTFGNSLDTLLKMAKNFLELLLQLIQCLIISLPRLSYMKR